jgi:hypothetical protein
VLSSSGLTVAHPHSSSCSRRAGRRSVKRSRVG